MQMLVLLHEKVSAASTATAEVCGGVYDPGTRAPSLHSSTAARQQQHNRHLLSLQSPTAGTAGECQETHGGHAEEQFIQHNIAIAQ